jgi:hypothetical protein
LVTHTRATPTTLFLLAVLTATETFRWRMQPTTRLYISVRNRRVRAINPHEQDGS